VAGVCTHARTIARSCWHGLQRDPLQCILPSFLADQIATYGNQQQREAALSTLDTTTRLRAIRRVRNVQLAPLRLARRTRRLVAQQFPLTAVLEEAVQVATGVAEICVFDAQNGVRLPGRQVRCGDDPATGDPAADEAYDGLLATYDFYQDVFGRDSIDNNGMPLNGVVHYDQFYDNAFWDGRFMVFGDGDRDLFNRFTVAVDVIGHELTHGVTQFDAGLIYLGQPGALNESISDVFGSLIKQYQLNQTADEADWLIGAGLFTANVEGDALRSMQAPGTAYDDDVLGQDPQPAHMLDYVRTFEDNFGVHINSGIPNHAFYQVAVSLGGPAWERAGPIWYDALQSPSLRPRTGFQDFARLTATSAQKLYGLGGPEVRAVRDGWGEVGITV
jgi:Zn-dependent metalloprotease